MPTATRISISMIWAISAAVVAVVTHAEAAVIIGMRAFWLSTPVVISVLGVYIAAPAIQAAHDRDGEATFLGLWIAVPTVCYAVLTVLVTGWVAVSEGLREALAVPLAAFIVPAIFPIFPFSAGGASFLATAATFAILAKLQSNANRQASGKSVDDTAD